MAAEAVRFCKQCGAQIAAISNFCDKCGARVEALAAPYEAPGPSAWLPSAATVPFPQAPIPATASGSFSSAQFIGPYRLVRELGRGGMGVVYLAMRDDGAFKKNVAIKLLLREAVNEEFVLRFKQERQVLAALDHPNIARILDGGDTPDGMPYYVMEYVEGLPLDEYCDRQRLSVTGRLRIFQQVCAAVEYLHQNSIVHRDLKPSNILVNNDGGVKLLDFGIAKLMGAAAFANPELTTAAKGSPMTPAYASPEQISGVTLQKTSDIYSMGAILYRMLTGRPPYEGVDEKLAKLFTRQAPPNPSANIREDLRADDTTARLRRAMMGELDSIVLKSLEFDPKERYQTAAEFSADLQHFLDGEPVVAHHASVAKRSFRLLKRKRALIAVLAGFIVLAGFGAWQWRRVEAQKAQIAERESHLRGLLDQVEARLDQPGAQPVADRTQDVQLVRTAFATDFPVVVAAKPGPSASRDALLDRGVHYIERAHSTAPIKNSNLDSEVAAAYQEFGILQENTADPKAGGRQAAVQTYQKASVVLVALAAENPNDAGIQARLATVNQKIVALGGEAPIPAQTVAAPEPEPAPPVAPRAAPQPRPQAPVQFAQPAQVAPAPPPPAAPVGAPLSAPPPSGLSAAVRAELDDHLISA
ncbi:MAG: serine/threonine-protein kinase, partial [Bryobacteraceae bacterium]